MLSMPKVMMKGCGSRSSVRPMPLSAPHNKPTNGPTRITPHQGTPNWAATAELTMPSASMEPTDKSIPAVMITKNMPSASSAAVAFCFRILVRLSSEKKVSDKKLKATIITSTTNQMP